MDLSSLPYVLLIGLLFGTSLAASRFGVGQFNPFTYVGLRFTLASLAFLATYWLRHRPLPADKKLWQHNAVLAIIGMILPMTASSVALLYLSSGLTSILGTVGPIITIMLAHFFLHDEGLNWRKLLGVALALVGALLLILRGESGLPDVGRANPLGYLLMLLSMLSVGATNIYIRRYMRGYDGFDSISIQIFIAALIMLPLSLLLVGLDLHAVTWQGYAALLYGVLFGTFVVFQIYFFTAKMFGATAVAMSNYVMPIFASLTGVLILQEAITTGMLAGVAIIAVGIFIVNSGQQGNKTERGKVEVTQAKKKG